MTFQKVIHSWFKDEYMPIITHWYRFLVYPWGFIVISLPCGLHHRVEWLGQVLDLNQSYKLPFSLLWYHVGIRNMEICPKTVRAWAINREGVCMREVDSNESTWLWAGQTLENHFPCSGGWSDPRLYPILAGWWPLSINNMFSGTSLCVSGMVVDYTNT